MKLTNDNINRVWDKLINTAVTTNSQKTFNVTLPLNINGEVWEAYTADVSNRDILFYCNQGVATYFVDTYGEKHTTELFTWEKD